MGGTITSRTKKWLRLAAQVILIGLVFFFLIRTIIHDWTAITEYEWNFELPWLVLSLIMLSATYSGHAAGWLLVLWLFQHPVPFLQGYYVWGKSLLARYVPGNVLMVVGRMMMIERFGVPKRVSLTSIAYEQVLLVASGTIVLSIALPLWPALRDLSQMVWLILLVPPAAIIGLHPRVIGTLGNYAFKKVGREPISVFLPFPAVLCLTLYYCLFWITGGIALFAMAHAVTDQIDLGDLPIAIASFPLAWLMSVIFFISPSGLGVREGVYAYTLGFAFHNAGVASAFAILARFWWTLVEITVVLVIMGLVKFKRPKTGQ